MPKQSEAIDIDEIAANLKCPAEAIVLESVPATGKILERGLAEPLHGVTADAGASA